MDLRILIPCLAASLIALPAMAKDPYEKADGSWISISGTAVSTFDNYFTLDYGDGLITVEVDDWDAYPEARPLLDGDKVTVTGRIDDDLLETAKIEAATVYVDSLKTYFHASAADEEGATGYWTLNSQVIPGHASVRGKVTAVDKMAETFTVDTGMRKITVETDRLGYNPVDDLGFQKVDPGDWVSVTGDMDQRLFEGRVLEARSLTTLMENEKNKPR